MASVKISDNTNEIKSTILQKSSIFLRIMGDRIVNISLPKTPKRTGRLRLDVLKQVLGIKGKIVWKKNYAAKQEIKQFKNYTTPGTGPHYAENAVKKGIIETEKIAKNSGLI